MANIELARQALQFIKDNPKIWDQRDFCIVDYEGSVSACFGGIVAKLWSGEDWPNLRHYVSTWIPETYTNFTTYGRVALDISEDQAYSLFFTANYCVECEIHTNLDDGKPSHVNLHNRHNKLPITFNEYVDVVSEVLEYDFSALKN